MDLKNNNRVAVNGNRGRNNGIESKDNCFKVVLLGSPGVGKTALTVRYLTKRFIGEYCPTLVISRRYPLVAVRTSADFLGAASPEHYASDIEHSIPFGHIILTLSTPVLPMSIIAERQAGGKKSTNFSVLESIYKYPTKIDDEDVKMEILDTAGQMLDGWKDGYGLWADCFIFVYSITDRDSFDEIINIKRQVENARHSSAISGILVGNKSDLLHDRQVPVSDGMELADEIGCKFYEVSAADWTQVTVIVDMFHDLFREYRRAKLAREGRQRKASSSVRFKQAIQKVISGKTPAKRTLSA